MADQSTPVKNTAFNLSFTLYKNDGTLIANPGTLTKKISKDFGDYADIGTITEEDTTYGQLKAALTATEMNADVVDIYVKDDTSGCVPFTCTLYPAAAAFAQVGAAMTLASGAVTAAAIATDAIDADALKADAVSEIQSGLSTLDAAGVRTAVGLASANLDTQIGTVDTVVDAIKAKTDNLPASPSGLDAAGVRTAVGLASANLDTQLDALPTAAEAATAVRSELGTELGRIDAAVSSRLATAGYTAPDNASITTIKGAVDTEVAAILAIANKLDTALELDGAVYRFTTNALEQAPTGGGSLTAQQVWEYATRTISDKTGFALTSAYDAAKTAASASDVASALGTYDAPTKAEMDAGLAALNDLDAAGVRSAVGLATANLDTQIGALPTAGENADAVWDEALAGHAGAGTAGAALTGAGSAGDPWSATIPGSYGAGTAGKVVGDNLNATVSSRLATAGYTAPPSAADNATAVWGAGSRTLSSFGTLVSDIATAVWGAAARTLTAFGFTPTPSNAADTTAIKAKTDNLPASPAATGAAMTLTAAYDAAKTAATQASVDDLPTNAELTTALAGADDAVLAAVAALNNLSAAGVRAAIGLASANLDTQLAAIPTDADVQTAAAAALGAYDPPTRAEATADKAEILAALPEGGAAPTAGEVADAVWDEALAGHAGAGTAGAKLASAAAAGDPWTAELPGTYESGTAGAVLPALHGAVAALGAGDVTVTSPVADSGTVTLYRGDDYDADHGRALSFAVADAGHALALDNPAAVVRFKCAQGTWSASGVTSTAEGYTATFEPTRTQTAALTLARQSYELEATLADADVVTLATGTLIVRKDIPAVT